MENELTVRETARGIAIRAGLLGIGGLVIGGLVTAEAMKLAGTFLKVGVATTVLAIGGGVAAWQVKKVQRRLTGPHEVQPAV